MTRRPGPQGGRGAGMTTEAVSLWDETAAEPEVRNRPLPEGRIDLAIVGGGFTGLSTALHAAEAGLSGPCDRGQPHRSRRLGSQRGPCQRRGVAAAVGGTRQDGRGPRQRLSQALRRRARHGLRPDRAATRIRCEATREGTIHAAHARLRHAGAGGAISRLAGNGGAGRSAGPRYRSAAHRQRGLSRRPARPSGRHREPYGICARSGPCRRGRRGGHQHRHQGHRPVARGRGVARRHRGRPDPGRGRRAGDERLYRHAVAGAETAATPRSAISSWRPSRWARMRRISSPVGRASGTPRP